MDRRYGMRTGHINHLQEDRPSDDRHSQTLPAANRSAAMALNFSNVSEKLDERTRDFFMGRIIGIMTRQAETMPCVGMASAI